MKPLITASAAATLLAFAGTAFAQPNNLDVARSVGVPYADLDLQSDNGAQAMYDRINIAAERVCRDEVNTPVVLHNRVCRDMAVDRAVRRLNEPRVTALLGTTPNMLATTPALALTESDVP